MAEPSLPELVRRLHALTPAEFTAARNDAATALRSEGRDDDAAITAALRRPVVAAWALNRLAADEPDALDELAEVGSELRSAQSAGDRVALRAATVARRAALSGALRAARRVADAAGQPLGATVLDQVEQTLQAAAVDAGAAAAVRSGMLVRPLTPAGLDAVELDGATALAVELPSIESARARRGSRGDADEADRDRERARNAADAALALAERERERAADRLATAERARDRLADERDELRHRVAAVQQELATAEREVDARTDALDAADDVVDDARDAVRAVRTPGPSRG